MFKSSAGIEDAVAGAASVVGAAVETPTLPIVEVVSPAASADDTPSPHAPTARAAAITIGASGFIDDLLRDGDHEQRRRTAPPRERRTGTQGRLAANGLSDQAQHPAPGA